MDWDLTTIQDRRGYHSGICTFTSQQSRGMLLPCWLNAGDQTDQATLRWFLLHSWLHCWWVRLSYLTIEWYISEEPSSARISFGFRRYFNRHHGRLQQGTPKTEFDCLDGIWRLLSCCPCYYLCSLLKTTLFGMTIVMPKTRANSILLHCEA